MRRETERIEWEDEGMKEWKKGMQKEMGTVGEREEVTEKEERKVNPPASNFLS